MSGGLINDFVNFQELRTRGVDAELSYVNPPGKGDLALQLLATNVDDLITSDGIVAVDHVLSV